jgi:predicted nuclease with TOPRIM domain
VGTSTETSVDEEVVAALTNGTSRTNGADLSDTAARFDALVKDRDALRTEVTQLRQSLEALQSKHEKDLESVNDQLQDTQAEKDEAQEQYQSLLGKVNTIRSQLGERLKADAVSIAPFTLLVRH